MIQYEYKKTDDNIPFREIKELGEQGWLVAANIATDESILWVRELEQEVIDCSQCLTSTSGTCPKHASQIN